MGFAVHSIQPYHYIHVSNLSTHIVTLVVGPKTYVCQQDEKVVLGPEKMITIPQMMYCAIQNPVVRGENGRPLFDEVGQVRLLDGEIEYRFAQKPFPLYPGELLKGSVESLPVLVGGTALHLRALEDYDDGIKRIAGDEWLFEGPGTYYPRKEVEVVCLVKSKMVKKNHALVMEAKRDLVDRDGVSRIYGEKWLVTKSGAYLPGVYEVFVEERKAHVLTASHAIHVKSLQTHTDAFNKLRRVGDEYMLTYLDTDSYICDVTEVCTRDVHVTVLGVDEYCVIVNPVDKNGVSQLGGKRLVCGPQSFFLHPGEELQSGIEKTYILGATQGVILRASERFTDVSVGENASIIREAGDLWLLHGPTRYIPPVEVEVVERRSIIPLSANEGVYVRNTKTGSVTAVFGHAHMLNHDEELWSKDLPSEVEQLLMENRDPLADRGKRSFSADVTSLDHTRVVTLQVPHNSVVQIYDYVSKVARIEFGPTLAVLGPHEQFTRLSLSGGKPKKPNTIKSLCLLLGPDFCSDIVTVETADHARLSLHLSYNWYFDRTEEDEAKLFAVPDFIGDMCKTVASRVRAAVASVTFDDFHKNSSRIIRASMFGVDETGKVRDRFVFPQNNLVVTNIDVQSVEPVDQRTRDALQKSVQLAIEITTNSQEAAARHEAERHEQEARGKLERQKIEDDIIVEVAKRKLLDARISLTEVESVGRLTAEARSQAEASRIAAEAAVQEANLRAEASQIETKSELERLKLARDAELSYIREKESLRLHFREQDVEIDVKHFERSVNSIGGDNLRLIATASSDQQLKMLTALGLQSTLITDGKTPLNLVATAHGLIGSDLYKKSGRADAHSDAPLDS